MAYSQTRGGFYNSATSTEIVVSNSTGKILSEEISLKAGLFRQPVPFTGASVSLMTSLYGRVRVIILRGVKFGTQTQLETFIRQFTSHIDVNGTQSSLRYYPLLHPSHYGGTDGVQDQYYAILVNDFTYRLTSDDAGLILEWELELFEGTTVL